MWEHGVIEIPLGRGKVARCEFWAKVYEEGSEFGINGGRISKLSIKLNGKETCNYERGWDIRPTDEATKQAYDLIIKAFN